MHQNDASALSPSFFVVGQFFLYLTFPLLLRLAVYFEYVFLSMPSKWTLQIAPGTKFLRHLGSQCARAHPGKSRKIKKNKIQEENQKCDCQTILYGAIPSKYIDWLIDHHGYKHHGYMHHRCMHHGYKHHGYEHHDKCIMEAYMTGSQML